MPHMIQAMVSRSVFVELEGLHEALREERAGHNRAISEAGMTLGFRQSIASAGSKGLGPNSQVIEHGSLAVGLLARATGAAQDKEVLAPLGTWGFGSVGKQTSPSNRSIPCLVAAFCDANNAT